MITYITQGNFQFLFLTVYYRKLLRKKEIIRETVICVCFKFLTNIILFSGWSKKVIGWNIKYPKWPKKNFFREIVVSLDHLHQTVYENNIL
jgi:hypothetical protein